MDGYSFHQGVPEREAKFLFNRTDHLLLQSAANWMSFYIRHHSRGVVGMIHFNINSGIAQSPHRAPFGSIELDDVPTEVVYDFIEFIETTLLEAGVTTIIIKDIPALFRPEVSPLIHTFLFNHGYQIKVAEVSAVVELNAANPDDKLMDWERRKLKQCREAGFLFVEESITSWRDLYQFILLCREQKGYVLSMTEEALEKTIEKFPQAFRFYSVRKEDKLAAACISILVEEHILYIFYFDHDSSFDAFSPVVMLINEIGKIEKGRGVNLIDLGTSAFDGQPNFGLLDFKLRLGSTPSPKFTFEKTIRS